MYHIQMFVNIRLCYPGTANRAVYKQLLLDDKVMLPTHTRFWPDLEDVEDADEWTAAPATKDAISCLSFEGLVEVSSSPPMTMGIAGVLPSTLTSFLIQPSNLFFCLPARSLVLIASSCFFVGAGSCIL
jgi:hypothetical protein